MTEKIAVVIGDQARGKLADADLSKTVPMSNLVPGLVTMLELPSEKQYRVYHKRTGRQLSSDESLADAGVKPGDTLQLLTDITGAKT